ncbi:hypothetical protein [Streptomyces sp. TRM49041]|uniref:hypothetical protein n=1 Tax=Streptomyces sp. TRM49041 TaxID=2603216 RepID=UPI0016568B25|nr:hypothetical protein [Streptomyces sp. TRM49041]
MPEPLHDGYSLTHHYALPDDAWQVELNAPDGTILAIGVVPDEDPEREPSLVFNERAGHRRVPYEVMRRFMDEVADEIQRCRAWTTLPPAAVNSVVALRDVMYDGWADADYPALLTLLSEALPPDQVVAVVREVLSADADTVTADLAAPREVTARALADLRARMTEAGWRSGTTYE